MYSVTFIGYAVLGRIGHRGSAQRIHLDVAVAGEKVTMAVDQAAPEATIPQGTGASMTGLEPDGVTPSGQYGQYGTSRK